jgi:hypothetical protein
VNRNSWLDHVRHLTVNGVFYFRPAAEPSEPGTARGLDQEAWESIRDSQQRGVFQQFIEQYPNSRFVTIARLRLNALPPESSGAARRPVADESQAASLRDQFEQAFRLQRIGRAKEALKKYADAYERAREEIAILPPEKRPPEALQAVLMDLGYRNSVYLADIGRNSEGEEVERVLEALVGRYDLKSVSIEFLSSFMRFEEMEHDYYHDRHQEDEAKLHSQRDAELAARAAAAPDPGLDTLWLASATYNRRSASAEGAARDTLVRAECAFADRMAAKSPHDARAIDTRKESARRKGDLPGQLQKLQAARTLVADALKSSPDDRYFMLSMTYLENGLAALSENSGMRTEAAEHSSLAQDYFLKAIKDKTVFPYVVYNLKNLYFNLKRIEFSSPNKEQNFYRSISEAIGESTQAFPQAPGLAFVAADASAHVGELLAKDERTRPGAET